MDSPDAADAAITVEVLVQDTVVVEIVADGTLVAIPAENMTVVAEVIADGAINAEPIESATVVVEVLVPGSPGARGPSGPDATVLALPIRNASSFTANHAFAYAPRAWLVDQSGAEVETDILYAPGQVTAVFPAPFSGTLYLG